MEIPKGFLAGGVYAGIKKKRKNDISLFLSKSPCHAAALFTENRVQAAPVLVSKGRLSGSIHGILANSGCANCCTGEKGLADARRSSRLAARALVVPERSILLASTGVIGHPLPMKKIERAITPLAASLGAGSRHFLSAANGILTTDTFAKVSTARFSVGGTPVTLWGCAKGAGMIHPRLSPHATMLTFLLTDAVIHPLALRRALGWAGRLAFESITVDGDTSTNDTVYLLANGAAKNRRIPPRGPLYQRFARALWGVCLDLARLLAKDGEGATKLVTLTVQGASSPFSARRMADAVARSLLVKCALHGNDPNWGRMMAALGAAGEPFDPKKTDIWMGPIAVARAGAGVPFSEKAVRSIMRRPELPIRIHLNGGRHEATVYTCDLSQRYVRINADYHT